MTKGGTMRLERVLRGLVWTCAAAGTFVVFAWPFAVSANSDSPSLMVLSRAIVAILLAALGAAAALRAARRRRGPGAQS